jgi:hypothetical protein
MTGNKHENPDLNRPNPPPPPSEPGWYPVTTAEFEYRMNRVDATLADIDSHLVAVEETITQLGEAQMSTQADVDALTAALSDDDAELNTAVTGIQAEIAALQSANPALDLTALSAQVDATKAAVDAAAALVPPATS